MGDQVLAAVRPSLGFAAVKLKHLGSHVCGLFADEFKVVAVEEEAPPEVVHALIFACPGSSLEVFMLTLVSRRFGGL